MVDNNQASDPLWDRKGRGSASGESGTPFPSGEPNPEPSQDGENRGQIAPAVEQFRQLGELSDGTTVSGPAGFGGGSAGIKRCADTSGSRWWAVSVSSTQRQFSHLSFSARRPGGRPISQLFTLLSPATQHRRRRDQQRAGLCERVRPAPLA